MAESREPLSGRRLRLARLGSGLSQAELAEACGVSRQAVAGIERGAWAPSLPVALKLARALGRTVEELFQDPPDTEEVEVVRLAEPPPRDRRAQTVATSRGMVAVPRDGLAGTVPGFGPATSILTAATMARVPIPHARFLLVAGCDPALPLIAEGLRAAGTGYSFVWWPCGSREAVRLLQLGLVHAAGVHGATGSEPELPEGAIPVGFSRWREGLISAPHRPVDRLEEALERGLRLANREPGAEARAVFDRELGRLGVAPPPGYSSSFPGHLAVAGAVAAGAADLAVATEPAALALGLHFSPLSEEESLLLLPGDEVDSPPLSALLAALGHPAVFSQMEMLPGYDAAWLGATG
jgi:putative molybdopterin biosynthesis protein